MTPKLNGDFLSRNRNLIWNYITSWAFLPPQSVIKIRYHSIKKWSPLKDRMRLSVSNEGQLNREIPGCFKKNKYTQMENYILIQEDIIFQTNPAFCCDLIWKMSLLRYIHNSLIWFNFGCYFECISILVSRIYFSIYPRDFYVFKVEIYNNIRISFSHGIFFCSLFYKNILFLKFIKAPIYCCR